MSKTRRTSARAKANLAALVVSLVLFLFSLPLLMVEGPSRAIGLTLFVWALGGLGFAMGLFGPAERRR
jgi:uncharacterized RDD family membrane protein YckC